jgi:hypothetical protein
MMICMRRMRLHMGCGEPLQVRDGIRCACNRFRLQDRNRCVSTRPAQDGNKPPQPKRDDDGK